MKILVACEESQAVTIELRRLGHEAYSCDIEPCSGGHPEWHIQGDVLPLLNGDCTFATCDGLVHTIVGTWDMLIAFPPCTDLAVSGARYFAEKRADGRQQQSIEFFMAFANADCDRIAIENPVGIMSTVWRKPDQIINPYQFGHPEQKKTCLWLKGLPLLQETNNVYDYMMTLPLKERTRIHYMGSGHAKEQSKTYAGIARAIAEQWAGQCEECYRALTERTVSMEHDKLIEALEEEAQRHPEVWLYRDTIKCIKGQAAEIDRLSQLAMMREGEIGDRDRELAEKDKQLAAAVEDLRGLCWCCAHGKKWDKAPAWSNMTTCEHIRERGSLAVGGGKAGKDCPHWEYRGPQEAGEENT